MNMTLTIHRFATLAMFTVALSAAGCPSSMPEPPPRTPAIELTPKAEPVPAVEQTVKNPTSPQKSEITILDQPALKAMDKRHDPTFQANSPEQASSITPGLPPVTIDPAIREAATKLARKDASGWRIDEASATRLEKATSAEIHQLIALLDDKSVDARRGAAYHLLGKFDAASPSLLTAFQRRLSDDDRTVRGIALQAVQKMRPEQRIEVKDRLIAILESSSEEETHRTTSARILGSLGNEVANLLPRFAAVVKEAKSAPVRIAVLLTISKTAAPSDAVPIYDESLNHADHATAQAALARLRSLGPEATPAVESLGKLLEHDDESLRTSAAETLVRIGSPSLPALEAKLESSKAKTRELVVFALGKMGAVAAPSLPALKKRLKDDDPNVKKLAEAVVQGIEAQSK